MSGADEGVFVVAFGDDYGLMACVFLKSLFDNNDSASVHVETNLPWFEHFIGRSAYFSRRVTCDLVERPAEENRLSKVSMYDRSPFERTLFFDVDMLVTGDISPMFRILDSFDLAARAFKDAPRGDIQLGSFVGRELFWFQTQAIGFRKNDRTANLFRDWAKRFEISPASRDMPSFASAYLNAPEPIKFFQLTRYWTDRFGSEAIVQSYSDFSNERKIVNRMIEAAEEVENGSNSFTLMALRNRLRFFKLCHAIPGLNNLRKKIAHTRPGRKVVS